MKFFSSTFLAKRLALCLLTLVYVLVFFASMQVVSGTSIVLSEETDFVKIPEGFSPFHAGTNFSIWRKNPRNPDESRGILVSVNTRTSVVREYKHIKIPSGNFQVGMGGEMGFCYGSGTRASRVNWYYNEPTDKMLSHKDIGGEKGIFKFIYPYSRKKNIQFVAAAFDEPPFLYDPVANKIIARIELNLPTPKYVEGKKVVSYGFPYHENRTYVHKGRIHEVFDGHVTCRYSTDYRQIDASGRIVEGVSQKRLVQCGDVVVLLCGAEKDDGGYIKKQEYVTIDLKENILDRVTVDSMHRTFLLSDALSICVWEKPRLSTQMYNSITHRFEEVLFTENPEFVRTVIGRQGEFTIFTENHFGEKDIRTVVYKLTKPTLKHPSFAKVVAGKVNKIFTPLSLGRDEKFDAYDSIAAARARKSSGTYVLKGGVLAESIKLINKKYK